MDLSLVMTVIGPDRPGLVERLASLVADHRGNWLQSRMARLGGQFAGILRIQLPEDQEGDLINALQRLEKEGLKIVVQAEREAGAAESKAAASLEIVGQDRPGIVREISRALAQQNVNVEELLTECQSAAMSGETLFHARAQLQIPKSCDLAQLRSELERIAEDLFVEIVFDPHPVVPPSTGGPLPSAGS